MYTVKCSLSQFTSYHTIVFHCSLKHDVGARYLIVQNSGFVTISNAILCDPKCLFRILLLLCFF